MKSKIAEQVKIFLKNPIKVCLNIFRSTKHEESQEKCFNGKNNSPNPSKTKMGTVLPFKRKMFDEKITVKEFLMRLSEIDIGLTLSLASNPNLHLYYTLALAKGNVPEVREIVQIGNQFNGIFSIPPELLENEINPIIETAKVKYDLDIKNGYTSSKVLKKLEQLDPDIVIAIASYKRTPVRYLEALSNRNDNSRASKMAQSILNRIK